MTRWRVVLRLARREVMRRPGRTALVALLVALPVAGMVIAITLIRTGQTGVADEWAAYNGTADARTFDIQALDDLPTGSESMPVHQIGEMLRTEDGRRSWVGFTEPTAAARFDLGPRVVEGRLPTALGEVTLSRRVLDRLDASVGSTLRIDRPVTAELTVVGVAEDPGCLSCETGHATLETFELLHHRALDEVVPERWLIDLPPLDDARQIALVEGTYGSIMTRDLFVAGWGADPDGGSTGVRWAYVLGAVALTVVGIVISAAFAVGARRQLVTIGQLSASGAPPRTVRSALVLQGTVTGLAGAAAGLLLAVGLLLGFQGFVEELLDRRIDGYDMRLVEVLGAGLVGVLAATVAALIPARTAAVVPTLTALAGRRPLPPVPRRLVAWGAVAVAGGLGLLGIAVVGSRSGDSGELWAFVAIVGGVAELLGACAIAPAVVARLEPLAAHLRGSWRMAARGLARHRTRTGAVVGAVCATAGFAIAASALVQGAEARETQYLEIGPRLAVAALRAEQVREVGGGETVYEGVYAPLDATTAERVARILPEAVPFELRQVRLPITDDGEVARWAVPVDKDTPLSSGASTMGVMGIDGSVTYVGYDRLLVADEPVLDALDLTDRERAALEDVGVALLVGAGGGRETTAVEWTMGLEGIGSGVPVVTLDVAHDLGYVTSGILITEAAADELDLEVEPLATLYVNPRPLSSRERDQLDDLVYEIATAVIDGSVDGTASSGAAPSGEDDSDELPPDDADGGAEGGAEGPGTEVGPDGAVGREELDPGSPETWLEVDVRYPGYGPTALQIELALTGLALVFCLFVVGTSLALAAAESKDERDVLTVAGAPPRLLARMAGARAWLLAAIGAVMAVPVGFLPVVVFTRAIVDRFEEPFPLIFPLRTVLLLVVVVPLVVAAVAAGVSAVAQRVRPVRVSTAVFE